MSNGQQRRPRSGDLASDFGSDSLGGPGDDGHLTSEWLRHVVRFLLLEVAAGQHALITGVSHR